MSRKLLATPWLRGKPEFCTCIMFSRYKRDRVEAKKLMYDGHTLPWVCNVKHLGNILQSENSMTLDINMKRGSFIGKTNSLLQEFHYARPEVLLNLVNTYACNIYGSNIWDLFSTDCQRIFSSYNVMLRNIFNLHRTTHRYILETLSDVPHLYVQLIARYVTFVNSLLSNDAFEVRCLSNICLSDKTTIIGRSVPMILNACDHHNLTTLTARIVKLG